MRWFPRNCLKAVTVVNAAILYSTGLFIQYPSPVLSLSHSSSTSNRKLKNARQTRSMKDIPCDFTSASIVNRESIQSGNSMLKMNANVKGNISRRSFCVISQVSLSGCLMSFSSSEAHAAVDTRADNIFGSVGASDSGLAEVTSSDLGKIVRKKTVQGARAIDSLDEKWERFSDGLRDQKKCDDRTGRRLYDNGFRKDGTRVGNPVLGAICNPEPLKNLDLKIVEEIKSLTKTAAVNSASSDANTQQLENRIQTIKNLLISSFQQQLNEDGIDDDEKMRRLFNFEMYCIVRAIRDLGINAAQFEYNWGQKLIKLCLQEESERENNQQAVVTIGEEITDEDVSLDLLQSLEVLSRCLRVLQGKGFIGRPEINIPSTDYGSVITIAVDDDVTIQSQILLREISKNDIDGSILVALTKACIDKKRFSYNTDSFFLDPSSTKQSVFNPSQILINVSNLKER